MPMSSRRALRLFQAGVAASLVLLAVIGGLADRQLLAQQRAAALSELDAVASERKQQINELLARFAAEVSAGLPETSPERLAELAARVRPRHASRAGDDGELLDSEGRDVTRPGAAAQPAQAADCLAAGEGHAIQPTAGGGERVLAYRALPVHGLCLRVSADLAQMPAADRTPLRGLLLAVAALLVICAACVARAVRPVAMAPLPLPRAPQITDKQAAIRRLLPGGMSQDDFLGRVSHEVRTPLNGVLGAVGLLLKTPLDPQQQELVELARASGEDLLAAIDDILENPVGQAGLGRPADAVLAPGFASARVLLVEDNPTNQIVARLMLAQLGCTVEVAGDGGEALRRLDAADFDLLLMDCEMPGLDGYAATAKIRQRSDAKARLPIIAVTAQAMAGDRERCLAAGMDDYLSKPVTEAALAEALRRWLAPQSAEPAFPAVDPAGDHPRPPAVDPAVILRLRDLALATDPGLLAQILEAFRSDGAQHIASMEAAIAAGDRAALRAAAHVIKGASSTVGAAELTALAQQLYAFAPDQPLPTAQTLIQRISAEFVRALDEIARLDSAAGDPVGAREVHEDPDRR